MTIVARVGERIYEFETHEMYLRALRALSCIRLAHMDQNQLEVKMDEMGIEYFISIDSQVGYD